MAVWRVTTTYTRRFIRIDALHDALRTAASVSHAHTHGAASAASRPCRSSNSSSLIWSRTRAVRRIMGYYVINSHSWIAATWSSEAYGRWTRWLLSDKLMINLGTPAREVIGGDSTGPVEYRVQIWMYEWKRLLTEIKNIKLNTSNNIKQYIHQRCYQVTNNIYGNPKSLNSS